MVALYSKNMDMLRKKIFLAALFFSLFLKVLDQITLENKFCLNFKIRSVSI